MEVIKKEGSRPQIRRTDKSKAYTVPFFTDFVPKRSVSFPFAYLLTTKDSEILHKLLQHGLLVEKLTKPAKLEVESFRITEIKGAERLFQGHRMNSVKGEYNLEEKEFPVGTLFISTAQPLANVAVYLLEPESDDGFLVWNFLDRYVVAQWGRGPQSYPVYKLLKPANLVKERVK
jgi:hypothetical protein